jgi:hypothetical protein
MKIITSFLIVFGFTLSAFGQTLDWAKSFGGSSNDVGYSIKVDASGNVYTTGYFQGTGDYDPGAGTANLTSAGNYDVFIQKLDASSNLIWAKSFGGAGRDYGHSIAVDASGNVYTTGYFEQTVDFDPGAGTSNLTSVGARDVFVQKLDASGNFLWARSFGGTSNDYARCISVDASGNAYTTGYFQGTVDFDPGAGIDNHTSAGNNDCFVQKLDASGNFVWSKTFGGSLADQALSIAVDASGNAYTAGYFAGTSDFDPGVGIDNHTSAGSNDVFVQKLDASGNLIWAKSFGGSSSDVGIYLAVDASGNVYTTGYLRGTVDFDPGAGTTNLTAAVTNDDSFVQKLDASGNFVWAKTFGGTGTDNARSITVDASGNVYTTGLFSQTADFDPGAGTANLTAVGNFDVWVQKLDPSGNYVWAVSFGGTDFDYGYSIAVDASECVHTTGFFQGTVDIDPGAGTDNHTSVGLNDVFIQKICQCMANPGIWN